MAPFAVAEPREPMLRANSRAAAVAGSPRGARDHREDGEGLGPGDLRKGEGEGPGRGAVRHGRRGGEGDRAAAPGLVRSPSRWHSYREPAEFSERPTRGTPPTQWEVGSEGACWVQTS